MKSRKRNHHQDLCVDSTHGLAKVIMVPWWSTVRHWARVGCVEHNKSRFKSTLSRAQETQTIFPLDFSFACRKRVILDPPRRAQCSCEGRAESRDWGVGRGLLPLSSFSCSSCEEADTCVCYTRTLPREEELLTASGVPNISS